jgi:alcohol dehydrogenase class IV
MQYSIQYLIPTTLDEPENLNYREGLAYAALLSGITLANAGLGTVHGFASSIGGFHDIPHGVVCGTLMAETNRITIQRLKQLPPEISKPFLRKYAEVGALFDNKRLTSDDHIDHYCDILITNLKEMTDTLKIKKLGAYGVTYSDIESIVKATSNKNNPIDLTLEELHGILKNRI